MLILTSAVFNNVLNIMLPVKTILTCSESQRVSCLETLLFCWSPNRSSSQKISQSENGQSLSECLKESHQHINQLTGAFIAQVII